MLPGCVVFSGYIADDFPRLSISGLVDPFGDFASRWTGGYFGDRKNTVCTEGNWFIAKAVQLGCTSDLIDGDIIGREVAEFISDVGIEMTYAGAYGAGIHSVGGYG